MEREKRILVVDDDEAIRTLLLTILRRRGFAVDTARNGAEALEAMRRCRYSVAIVDLMMPVMSGWQVLDWLAAQRKGERPLAIVLTAGTMAGEMSPDVVAGSISKPFDVEMLIDMVTACAAVHREECPPAQSLGSGAAPTDKNVN